MSYNMKLENFVDLQTYKQLKPEDNSITVLFRVLSNKLQCQYKCQLKTVFVFIS